jgi:NAD(P)-dependent dehydrogenase (short-subunit alcohol dehydrogenase family)
MNVNAKAAWFWTSAVLAHMHTQRSGSVVLVASIAGKMATTVQHPVYNVSKAAVIAMTKTWAQTVAHSGIRVNCVCPGVIDTPMQEQVTASMVDDTHSPAQIIQQRISKVPMGRMGHAAEVATVVAFLLSTQASYIHGQALNIDGGVISY